jgi:hypothetical protein
MKKILPILVVGIMVLTGLGAVALENDIEESDYESVTIERLDARGQDSTHTVLIEVGTATWCPSCPASNSAWHNLYEGGQYDFEYTEMVTDKNSKANARMNQYNLYWVPTSYFDGGQFVYPGTNTNTFKNYLNTCGARSVPDLESTISAEWLGNAEVEVSFSIENNDNNDYPGRLRVYIIELESPRWNDFNGNPYYHAYLDSVWDQSIDIDSGDTLEDTKVWDGAAAGYSNVVPGNLQVILAVFDDTAHTSYSDPPSGAPFNAYYVDEVVAYTLPQQNQPPLAPEIDGETDGDVGTEYDYDFTATDPDGDGIAEYIVNWGDGTDDETLTGPFASGEPATGSHTYESGGDFEITAKAKDVYDAIGPEGSLDVTMPRGIISLNTLFMRILERFPHAFPLLRHIILGL